MAQHWHATVHSSMLVVCWLHCRCHVRGCPALSGGIRTVRIVCTDSISLLNSLLGVDGICGRASPILVQTPSFKQPAWLVCQVHWLDPSSLYLTNENHGKSLPTHCPANLGGFGRRGRSCAPIKGQNEDVNTCLSFLMSWLILHSLRGKLQRGGTESWFVKGLIGSNFKASTMFLSPSSVQEIEGLSKRTLGT